MKYTALTTSLMTLALAACGGDITFDGSPAGGNQAPIARATFVSTGADNLTIEFDGSLSSDADDVIVSYEWRLQGEEVPFSTDPVAGLIFSGPGELTASLTVTDSNQATDVINFSFIVGSAGEGGVTGGDGGANADGGDDAGGGENGGGENGGEQDPALLNEVANNVINGTPNCIFCHVPGGIAGASAILFEDSTDNNSIEAEIIDYIDADNPTNIGLLMSRPNGVGHGGGNRFNNLPVEAALWEAYITQLAIRINGSADEVGQ